MPYAEYAVFPEFLRFFSPWNSSRTSLSFCVWRKVIGYICKLTSISFMWQDNPFPSFPPSFWRKSDNPSDSLSIDKQSSEFRDQQRWGKKNSTMSSELKMLEISNEIHLHTEITVRLKQTATDSKTRKKERRCRWHGLHSWLISLILSLQFILNPANGFTESGLGDEFRLTFQYKSNLSYLFSLFNCNFSVCKIINSWKGGGWLQVHKIVPGNVMLL